MDIVELVCGLEQLFARGLGVLLRARILRQQAGCQRETESEAEKKDCGFSRIQSSKIGSRSAFGKLSQLTLVQDLDPEPLCVVELRAGVFARHDIVGLLAYAA